MSKMGQELEDRLTANKYEMYEALKLILDDLKENQGIIPPIPGICELWALGRQVIAKIEGGE